MTNRDGTAVAGALVVARSADGSGISRETKTGDDGRFLIGNLPAGECSVQIQGPNDVVRDLMMTASTDLVPQGVLFFVPKVTLRFSMPDGSPVGAQGHLSAECNRSGSGSGGGRIEADPSGRFVTEVVELWKIPPYHYLHVFPPAGYAYVELGEPERYLRETGTNVYLLKGATISGTVREEGTGRPVGGVEVLPRMKPWGTGETNVVSRL